MEGLWSRMARMILSMYCLRRRLISSCSFKASTSWERRGMHYKRSYIKNNRFIQPTVTDQPHLWKRCQSQLPGTGPWCGRRTGSWPRTSSDWESERSGRRFDRAACGSPTDTKREGFLRPSPDSMCVWIWESSELEKSHKYNWAISITCD